VSEDLIHLVQCPLCPNRHEYSLSVNRSVSLGMLTSQPLPTLTRRFVRLFTCPSTGNRFQATITLEETALSRIEGVEVASLLQSSDG